MLRQGAAMETVFHDDDGRCVYAAAVTVEPRDLDGGLVGLGAGIAEIDALREAVGGQAFGESHRLFLMAKNNLGNTEIRSDLVTQVREEVLHYLHRNKEIAQQIRDGGGDYVLAVKDNQPTLHAAIHREIFKKGKTARFKKVDRGLFVFNEGDAE